MGNWSEFHSERNYYLQNWYFSTFCKTVSSKPITVSRDILILVLQFTSNRGLEMSSLSKRICVAVTDIDDRQFKKSIFNCTTTKCQ